jgi:predicted P-loop ATPase
MFAYNEFTDRILVMRSLPGYENRPVPRQLSDHDEAALVSWLNWHGLSPNVSTVGMFIREIAFRAGFDPLRAWLTSLKWDGKPRIDRWLTYYAGAENTDYNRMVGRKFLISAAARGLSPGCKVDTMLVLEGAQSIGKSTLAFRLFGADYFSDQVGDVTSKDSAERIQGCWCVEVAEMDKFSRVEANAVKSFLSHREDRYRPAYGRNTVVRPRRCVFLGTINPDGRGYLKDKTGNRRFWPVAVSSVDLDAIEADREQLWAEAVAAWTNREPWWLSAEEEAIAAPEQDARRDDDVWEPRVRQWLDDREPAMLVVRFTSADCLAGLGLDAPRQGLSEKYRIATILKSMGCEVRNNQDGIRGRFWVYRRGQ